MLSLVLFTWLVLDPIKSREMFDLFLAGFDRIGGGNLYLYDESVCVFFDCKFSHLVREAWFDSV